MKQLIIISHSFLALTLLSGCASKTQSSPSQNSALNSVSKSSAAKKHEGVMQKSLDSWLKDDWEPTVSKDKEIQKKYMKRQGVKKGESNTTTEEGVTYTESEDGNFTLQELVDKAAAYQRAHPSDYNNSNVKKLQSMPVIGK